MNTLASPPIRAAAPLGHRGCTRHLTHISSLHSHSPREVGGECYHPISQKERLRPDKGRGLLTGNCPVGSISKQSEGQTIVNINEVCRCKNESDMPPCPEEVPGCGEGL